jgi:hypothetical protein
MSIEEFELRIEVLQDGKPIGIQPVTLRLEAAHPKLAISQALDTLQSALKQFVHVEPEMPQEDEEAIAEQDCAETHEDEQALFRVLAARARARGYKLILGLLDDLSIYQVVALCKWPEMWRPYKAHRYFEEADAMALWWFHESVGAGAYNELDIDEAVEMFAGLNSEDKKEVLKRMGEVVFGKITERWDAPRSD